MCINWGAGGVARSAHKGSDFVDMDRHSGWGAGDTTSPHGLVGWWGLCGGAVRHLVELVGVDHGGHLGRCNQHSAKIIDSPELGVRSCLRA